MNYPLAAPMPFTGTPAPYPYGAASPWVLPLPFPHTSMGAPEHSPTLIFPQSPAYHNGATLYPATYPVGVGPLPYAPNAPMHLPMGMPLAPVLPHLPTLISQDVVKGPLTELQQQQQLPTPQTPTVAGSNGSTCMATCRDCETSPCTQLIVNYLAPCVDSRMLQELFSPYGPMHGARVIYDKDCRRTKGFGFVYYHQADSARQAIQALNRKPWHGKVLKVEFVRNPIPIAQ